MMRKKAKIIAKMISLMFQDIQDLIVGTVRAIGVVLVILGVGYLAGHWLIRWKTYMNFWGIEHRGVGDQITAGVFSFWFVFVLIFLIICAHTFVCWIRKLYLIAKIKEAGAVGGTRK